MSDHFIPAEPGFRVIDHVAGEEGPVIGWAVKSYKASEARAIPMYLTGKGYAQTPKRALPPEGYGMGKTDYTLQLPD